MQHDAVRDGRHLMENDGMGKRVGISRRFIEFYKPGLLMPRIQEAINRAESERLEAIEHPNYRYTQERTDGR